MCRCLPVLTVICILLSVIVYAKQPSRKTSVQDTFQDKSLSSGESGKALNLLKNARFWIDTVPERAFNYIFTALRISIAENNIALKAEAFVTLGDYSFRRRHFLQAQQQYLSAVKNYQFIRDTSGVVSALLEIGYINQILNHNQSALGFFNQALALSQRMKNIELQGQCLYFIGIIYQMTGDYVRAESFYRIAVSNFQRSGKKKEEIMTLNNMGCVLLDQKKYDEALLYYKNLADRSDTESSLLLGNIYTRIGHIYDQKKDFGKSLYYNRKALEIRQKQRIQFDVNSSLINIAGDFFNMGRLDSAMYYLNTGMALAKNINQLHLVMNGYRHLYRYFEKKGDFRQTLKYYGQYASLHEELLVEQSKTHIGIIEARQELQVKVESGKQLMQNNRIQSLVLANQQFLLLISRVLSVVAGIVLVIFCIVYFYNRRASNRMQVVYWKLMEEVTEREQKEQQTRNTEMKFRFLSENSVDFITHINSRMERIYASPACRQLYGYEPEEALNKTIYDLIHPDFHVVTEAGLNEMISTKTTKQFIFKALKKDGSSFWVESVVNPLFEVVTGKFKGIVGVTRDIQERKTKEFEIMEGTRQKENLLKEIHHRVKNNFAILVSLINMQMTEIKEPSVLKSFTNLQLRIRSMALVHEMLYRSQDFEKISFPEYIRSLASVISGTFNRRNVALTIEAEEAVINIDASIPLGLIVNELLSNAYIHAFPDGRAGTISLSFAHVPDNGHYLLIIQDDGIGLPENFSIDHVKTMGLQIVNLLTKQIEGALVIENNPGTFFSISFQISNS